MAGISAKHPNFKDTPTSLKLIDYHNLTFVDNHKR